jgi:ATP-dependent Clp protease ATP-binding subunit ClpA
LNLNKFTEKAQEAILEAQGLAAQYNHSQIDPEHLLLSLLQQTDGVVPQIVQKRGGQLVFEREEVLEKAAQVNQQSTRCQGFPASSVLAWVGLSWDKKWGIMVVRMR